MDREVEASARQLGFRLIICSTGDQHHRGSGIAGYELSTMAVDAEHHLIVADRGDNMELEPQRRPPMGIRRRMRPDGNSVLARTADYNSATKYWPARTAPSAAALHVQDQTSATLCAALPWRTSFTTTGRSVRHIPAGKYLTKGKCVLRTRHDNIDHYEPLSPARPAHSSPAAARQAQAH